MRCIRGSHLRSRDVFGWGEGVKVVKLVGGGLVINGAILSNF